MRETPEQNFTPEGQGFQTAGMCLVKTWWGCLGSWKPPHGNSIRTTALPQPEAMNLKMNLSDPPGLKNCLGKNVVESSNYLPHWGEPERGKKREMLLLPLLKESARTKR